MSKRLKLPKKGFSLTNSASGESAEILIYDQIGADFFGEGITAKGISEELKKLPKNLKELTVRINSPGGSVFEGMTIYERLKGVKAKKKIYIDGLAASIASIIALAGDEIIMGEGAMYMIHKPWSFTIGNSSEHEASIDLLDKIEDQMIGIYSRKTKMSRAEISKLLAGDKDGTWMTGTEALGLGFVDELTEDTVKVAASALKKIPWIKNTPEITDTFENKIKQEAGSLIKNVEDFLARK